MISNPYSLGVGGTGQLSPPITKTKGGAASVGPTGTVGSTDYAQIDPAASPTFSKILEQLQNNVSRLNQMPGQVPSYQSLVEQGVNSPLLQSVLKPALANLLPGQELANQAIMDQMRSAGMLGSSAHGEALARQQNYNLGQEGNLISQVISSMLPQMAQGLGNEFNQRLAAEQAPANLLEQILGLVKPGVVTGNAYGAGGGGGGGGGVSFGGPIAGSSGTMGPGNITNQMRVSGGYGPTGGPSYMSPDLTSLGGMDYAGGGTFSSGTGIDWFANDPSGGNYSGFGMGSDIGSAGGLFDFLGTEDPMAGMTSDFLFSE